MEDTWDTVELLKKKKEVKAKEVAERATKEEKDLQLDTSNGESEETAHNEEQTSPSRIEDVPRLEGEDKNGDRDLRTFVLLRGHCTREFAHLKD
ncbi:hypothetical protein Pint_18251 [Pistacia integerrima]|uniref:Uncharacterized protein n=1 Tax=Pistacia integerrima TaxID=434235 RepID=A0ACC0Z173_9ROSI|nr:hypothetical protein Pint_18251 [Pistacia integerrima]